MRYICPLMFICDRGSTNDNCVHARPHTEIISSFHDKPRIDQRRRWRPYNDRNDDGHHLHGDAEYPLMTSSCCHDACAHAETDLGIMGVSCIPFNDEK